MGAHAFPFRETEVHAASAAEAKPTADYLTAADLLPAYARKHADAADVASLARLLLASVMADGLTGSLAANTAVRRAAQRLAEQARKVQEEAMGDTYADAADAEEAGTPLAAMVRANYPAPDACARITDRDRLAMVIGAVEDAGQRALLTILAKRQDAWGNGHGADADKPSGPALAAILASAPVKRGRRTAALAADALAALAALDAGDMPAWAVLPARAGEDVCQPERGLLRDTSVPTSGEASAVVRTFSNGERWITYADHSSRVTDEQAVGVLAWANLPAASVSTARADEELRASLAAPSTLLPMRRPAGVGVGMTYGTTGQQAGEGYAEMRPVTSSRKRKRDGGIGGAMLSGRSSMGHGTAGKAADAGRTMTSAEALARRTDAMTDAQRANLTRLQRASVKAAADLKAATDADAPVVVAPAPVRWQYDAAWLASLA